MERRLIDYSVTAVAAAAAAYAKDTFFRAPGRELLSYAISILAGLLAFLLLNLIRYLLERVFRLDPRFAYLGFWIEDSVNADTRTYSLFEIKHNLISNSFSVIGSTYDACTHELFADFSSIAVSFPEENKLYYLHKSCVVGRKGEISGLTRLNFAGNGGKVYEGTGYFINNAEPLEAADFVFERLWPADIRRWIDRDRVSSRQDRRKLMERRLRDFDGVLAAAPVAPDRQGGSPV